MTKTSLHRFSNFLASADRILYRFEEYLAFISGFAIFSLLLLAVFSVGGRNLFNSPLVGYVDWIEQAMPLIAFVAISYVQKEGSHIRMDIVLSRFRGRFFWFIELCTNSLIFSLIILLVYGSYSHFSRSFDFTAPLWSRDSSIDINLPLWPTKLLIPLAFSVLCLRLLIQIFGCIRMIILKDAKVIAVPLIDDIATQANKEADAMSPIVSSEAKNFRKKSNILGE